MRPVAFQVMYGVYGLHEPDTTETRPAWLPARREAGPSCYLPWMRGRAPADETGYEIAIHRPDGSVRWIGWE